ncbi:hypothetical protein C2R22_17645 [Salinigranum rubrum]|uniref:Uncharacterized protein n=1 Tax=Salinigranum rubrum TaxID=755307 RepID=A0A2I8VQ44_9EURY|nr:hypothetical protein [Salinigranum rubrum]AUV83239.1 hypothetical protein C2R22_17645 [Salinigranum rubrum]
MVSSRTLTALAGLVVSLLVSVVLWWQFDTLAFFLFVPFVPFLFRGRGGSEESVRTCPACGFRTEAEEYDYCPRDGTRLE